MRFEAEVREYYREKENFDELPKQNINILEDSPRKRYPDIVFEKEIDEKMVLHVIEVKNVKRLSLTA